eukprot:338539-Chlamydomonas_euryale.AAC.1
MTRSRCGLLTRRRHLRHCLRPGAARTAACGERGTRKPARRGRRCTRQRCAVAASRSSLCVHGRLCQGGGGAAAGTGSGGDVCRLGPAGRRKGVCAAGRTVCGTLLDPGLRRPFCRPFETAANVVATVAATAAVAAAADAARMAP